jgi:hypothetical protein
MAAHLTKFIVHLAAVSHLLCGTFSCGALHLLAPSFIDCTLTDFYRGQHKLCRREFEMRQIAWKRHALSRAEAAKIGQTVKAVHFTVHRDRKFTKWGSQYVIALRAMKPRRCCWRWRPVTAARLGGEGRTLPLAIFMLIRSSITSMFSTQSDRGTRR